MWDHERKDDGERMGEAGDTALGVCLFGAGVACVCVCVLCVCAFIYIDPLTTKVSSSIYRNTCTLRYYLSYTLYLQHLCPLDAALALTTCKLGDPLVEGAPLHGTLLSRRTGFCDWGGAGLRWSCLGEQMCLRLEP